MPTTFIWFRMGVSATRTQRCSAACTASHRVAPSASSCSILSFPAGAALQLGSAARTVVPYLPYSSFAEVRPSTAQHSAVLSHGAAHAERQGMMGYWRQGLPTANSSRSAVSPTDTPDIAFPSIMPAIQGSLLNWVSTGIRSAQRGLADMGR